ncbi:MAG: hypothetical protein M1816_001076 [Peltula sp. TS41687]|nr:MAG: hypothetical protein M1816_001076 [Peltula sp. TS41687]
MTSKPRSVSFSNEPIRNRYIPTAAATTATQTLPEGTSRQQSASTTRRPKMSLAQTCNLAHTARAKLSREAGRADHKLRLLVGHANLLDCLTLELAEAQREQEHWFNQTLWMAEDVVEAVVEDDDSDSSDSSDSSDDDDFDIDNDIDDEESQIETQRGVSLLARSDHPRTTNDVTITISPIEFDDDDEEYEDDEADSGDLALVRISSHPPPELLQDDSEDSEDDMPPSPPQPILHDFTEDERKAISTTSFYDDHRLLPTEPTSRSRTRSAPLFEDEYFLPRPETSSTTVQAF